MKGRVSIDLYRTEHGCLRVIGISSEEKGVFTLPDNSANLELTERR